MDGRSDYGGVTVVGDLDRDDTSGSGTKSIGKAKAGVAPPPRGFVAPGFLQGDAGLAEKERQFFVKLGKDGLVGALMRLDTQLQEVRRVFFWVVSLSLRKVY